MSFILQSKLKSQIEELKHYLTQLNNDLNKLNVNFKNMLDSYGEYVNNKYSIWERENEPFFNDVVFKEDHDLIVDLNKVKKNHLKVMTLVNNLKIRKKSMKDEKFKDYYQNLCFRTKEVVENILLTFRRSFRMENAQSAFDEFLQNGIVLSWQSSYMLVSDLEAKTGQEKTWKQYYTDDMQKFIDLPQEVFDNVLKIKGLKLNLLKMHAVPILNSLGETIYYKDSSNMKKVKAEIDKLNQMVSKNGVDAQIFWTYKSTFLENVKKEREKLDTKIKTYLQQMYDNNNNF